MIEQIDISGCATYDATNTETMDGLKEINFIYGPNGSGKTTISKIIANEISFPRCTVRWHAGTKLAPFVYNREFVAANFNQSTGLKGIFTLGEKDIDTLDKIAAAKLAEAAIRQKIEGLNQTLGGLDGKSGKTGDLADIESAFRDECWKLKTTHGPKLQGALVGFMGDKQKFKEKLLLEKAGNTATVLTQAQLEKKAETVFGQTPVAASVLPTLDFTAFSAWENDPILKKRVIGKTDVDIAGLIQKLGNSDWVKQGIEYLKIADESCPFCQQTIPETLADSFAEYFDEAFEKDAASVEELRKGYKLEGERLHNALQAVLTSPSGFLDAVKFKSESDIFDARFQLDLQKIETKHKEPSQVVTLETLTSVLDAARQLITDANQQIVAHNTMVNNLGVEKQTLTRQVWKFFIEVELKTQLPSYEAKKAGVVAAIANLNAQIATAAAEERSKQAEIKQLEKSTTSIQPTINEINRLLASFGFQGFSLGTSSCGKLYTLNRADGSDAQDTLSEGEKSFVTFLYFYHLLKGSENSSGVTTDRVVVFDDPVSSLDSDILFIVGSLIKGLFEEVRAKQGHIKQIFVLTHNIYFHKEVAFNPRRKSGLLSDETFWIISKPSNVSKVKKFGYNPIKTSYELLWADVRKPDLTSHTIQNTLRRILENYFKILGNMDSDSISNEFQGRERIICKSLFSWVNDGSHSAHDDLHISQDGSAVESYLQVFRKIFEQTKHLAHYRMMMGDDFVEHPVPNATVMPTVASASPSA